jgi:putative phage-type endonuclease
MVGMEIDMDAGAVDRRRYIGGSDAAAILGVSPWRDNVQCWQSKIDCEAPVTDPARLKVLNRGKRLEPVVLDMLAEETGIIITQRNQRYTDPELHYLKAEIDAQAQSGENIEIKTVNAFAARDWGEAHEDGVPLHYLAQVQHGLMVTSTQVCIVAALIGLDDLRIYRIARDEETIAGLRQQEIEFWGHVQNRTPPEPKDAAAALRLFVHDDGSSVEADEALARLHIYLRDKRLRAKVAAAQADQYEQAIKLAMGNASTITYQGQILATWKTQDARRFDAKAFAAAHPDLHEQFKTVSQSRVFRLK